MSSELPPFAKEWAQQWKRAAPALQAIRDQELRQMDKLSDIDHDNTGDTREVVRGHRVYDRYPERHGMVIMQRWFMRLALLEQFAKKDT